MSIQNRDASQDNGLEEYTYSFPKSNPRRSLSSNGSCETCLSPSSLCFPLSLAFAFPLAFANSPLPTSTSGSLAVLLFFLFKTTPPSVCLLFFLRDAKTSSPSSSSSSSYPSSPPNSPLGSCKSSSLSLSSDAGDSDPEPLGARTLRWGFRARSYSPLPFSRRLC